MNQPLREVRIPQYDVLRVIATLLVVISHGHYHAFQTGFGGIDYSALMVGGDLSWKLIRVITEFINSFTMPTFMALGGALFYRSMERGKFQTLGKLAVDKAKRLLIPFLVVSVLYSFPLKLVTGYFSGSDNVLRDFLLGQLLIQGNTHLWYLIAMFIDFLICYVLEVYIKVPRLVKLAVLAVVSVTVWNFQIYLVAYPLRYMVWFYAGYCFESQRERIGGFAGSGWGILGCVAAGVVYFGVRSLLDGVGISGVLRTLSMRLLVPGIAASSLYALSCGLARTKALSSKLFRCLSRNTFGIYLYSDPVNYVILYMGATFFGPFLFADSFGIFVLYFLRIAVTLICSILVSELLRRCKVKYIV